MDNRPSFLDRQKIKAVRKRTEALLVKGRPDGSALTPEESSRMFNLSDCLGQMLRKKFGDRIICGDCEFNTEFYSGKRTDETVSKFSNHLCDLVRELREKRDEARKAGLPVSGIRATQWNTTLEIE